MLGAVCGLLGVFFINLSTRLISLKEQNTYPLLYGRYRYTLLISSIVALASYITDYTRLSDREVINDMFSSSFSKNGWNSYNLILSLGLFSLLKILFTSFCLSTHIPAGVLYPLLAAGASIGGLFGYLMDSITNKNHLGIYAAVGAASLVSATTHTISVTVIVFELTGQINYFLPMIVSVLVAYSISSSLTLSIYDALLEIKGLPYLPSLKPASLHASRAVDIMEPDYPQIVTNCTLNDLLDSINDASLIYNKIPVVDQDYKLLYDVSVNDAKSYLRTVIANSLNEASEQAKKHLEYVISYLFRKNKDFMIEDGIESIFVASEENEEIRKIFSKNVDFSSELLNADDSPFSINESTPLSKIHFLFIMLGLNQVYVIKKGILVGMISRESFTKSRNINH